MISGSAPQQSSCPTHVSGHGMFMRLNATGSDATTVWVSDGGVILYGPDGSQSATFTGRGGRDA
ncbi:hypothetical protein [Planomonospora parontospora]|uniref:hypothetical protein n=1 Tax=Planomonospora parontospora TaxID=58119 RepID=UPI00166FE36C|nr:hypothetical protein [Planomonospora parontospora]GGL41201.1 hypothetical protein GCM10014719_48070 [Planomonospora parontospora subsp. antibiotica]GII17936.1 hypothetical protein Ppa05_46620 [Planomonospora parontospora subsp. antibiotica]